MDLTGVRLNCRSTDSKKQIPGYQQYQRFSTASSISTKMVHYPFVRLAGNKVEENSIYLSNIDTGTSKPTIISKTNAGLFRNFSKSCHQLPDLISGFVASKSQVHSDVGSHEPHQIWDNTIRRLGEFVRSNCNLLGRHNLGADNSAIEFILPNDMNCHSKNSQVKSVEPIPIVQNTLDLIPNTNENKQRSNPTLILNICEHFSEPVFLNLQSLVPCKNTDRPTQALKPQVGLEFAGEPVILYQCGVLEHLVVSKPEGQVFECRSDPLKSSKPIPIVVKENKSYAEVAKMCQGRVRHRPSHDKREEKMAHPSCQYLKKDYFRNNRNKPKSYQRSVDKTNWREQNSEMKDLRRDKFLPVHCKECVCPNVKLSDNMEKCKSQSQCGVNTKINHHRYQKRNHGRYNNDRHYKNNDLEFKRVVHERHPNYDKKHYGETEVTDVETCQYYNPKEKCCKNWRCRQHSTKSSPSRDISNSSFELSPKNLIKNTCQMLSRGFNNEQRSTTSSDSNGVNSLPTFSPERRPMKSLSKLKEISLEAINNLRRRSFSENKDSLLTTLSRATLNCVNRDGPAAGSLSSSNSGSVRRSLSECSVDSEDSFVIFGEEVDDCKTIDSEESDLSSDWSDCETESEDEVDATAVRSVDQCEGVGDYSDDDMSPRLREINQRWAAESRSTARCNRTSKKVCFASPPAVVHPMVRWEYAYRAARCGPWEEYARDRERFRLRVTRCEATLAAVLVGECRERARLRNARLDEAAV